MTFGFGLDAGLRALQAARYGMQTAGNVAVSRWWRCAAATASS